MHATAAHSATPPTTGSGLFAAPTRRHLLGLEGVPRHDILEILDEAVRYRDLMRRHQLPTADLRGVTICNAFFEDSTRTRVSFELAEQGLGAILTSFHAGASSVSKGETLLDTLRVIASMRVDVFVVRHASSGAAAYLAHHLDAAVVNAGDGRHEHPTQGLLDLMTLRQAWEDRWDDRRIAIVGDIAHSRVARSAIFGLTTLGVRVTVAGPATLMPAEVESLGCEVARTVEDAMRGADAVMTLRIQKERMEAGLLPSLHEYSRVWGITAKRVSLMRPEAVVLHPGPMNRGVEINPDVADGPRSVIFDQVENGVAIRCAVLRRCAAPAASGGTR
ncbi:MAG TPA: aspartate carbamoyltransferase catalytic subunit [Dongiaceae bacterium]|nr:aspartate carbamoyltransferase catalytic subunit [Dongiaceae bacterium]